MYLRQSLLLFQLMWVLLWLFCHIRIVADHRLHLFIVLALIADIWIAFACILLERVPLDVSIAAGLVCVVFCFGLTIICVRVTATILGYDFCLGNALDIVLTYFYIFCFINSPLKVLSMSSSES